MKLEPEIEDFIATSEALYTTSVAATIEDQRAVYDHICTHFTPAHPSDLKNRYDVVATPECNVPVRWYWKNNDFAAACIVYFHGGGFVVGGLESHDFICARLADDSNCKVVSVDYRLAPEFVFPAAFDDCFNVLRALQAAPEKYAVDANKIIVCGDSAGGNLAAAVALANRDCGGTPLLGQILIYPALAHELTLPSYTECANAPMLTTQDVIYYNKTYLGERGAPSALSSPLQAVDFSNLAPALLLPVEYDPLRDDSFAYHEKLQTAGSPSDVHLGRGLVHGCLRAIGTSPGVGQMVQKILTFISELTRQ
jgi:acetyl esterase